MSDLCFPGTAPNQPSEHMAEISPIPSPRALVKPTWLTDTSLRTLHRNALRVMASEALALSVAGLSQYHRLSVRGRVSE